MKQFYLFDNSVDSTGEVQVVWVTNLVPANYLDDANDDDGDDDDDDEDDDDDDGTWWQ